MNEVTNYSHPQVCFNILIKAFQEVGPNVMLHARAWIFELASTTLPAGMIHSLSWILVAKPVHPYISEKAHLIASLFWAISLLICFCLSIQTFILIKQSIFWTFFSSGIRWLLRNSLILRLFPPTMFTIRELELKTKRLLNLVCFYFRLRQFITRGGGNGEKFLGTRFVIRIKAHMSEQTFS